MPDFKDVLGNEEIIGHFKNAIKSNKVSHAYVLNGEKGMGKKTIAKAFAMTLQCEENGEEACLKCHSCLQAMSDNHPDIIWVTHEKPTSVGVEDVREQIINDVQVKPYSSKYKVYIVEDAGKLTPAAQNAFLKTMEEPPDYAVILLLTENVNVFLPTIISRCIVMNLKPLSEITIKKYLMSNYEIPDYQAEIAAAFSSGNMGKAITLASSERFNEIRGDVVHFLKYIEEMETYDIIEAVKHFDFFIGSIRIDKYYVRTEAVKNSLKNAENNLLDIIQGSYLPNEVFEFIKEQKEVVSIYQVKKNYVNQEGIFKNSVIERYIDRVCEYHNQEKMNFENRKLWLA